MALHPQVEALVAATADQKPIHEGTVEEARLGYVALGALMGPGPDLPSVTDRTIPGPAGAIPVRVYTPEGEGPFALTVFYHGGGFVIGDLDSHDRQCRVIAAEAGCVVMAVHYRLGPEHPFPAAPEDATAALRWAAEHAAELGADGTRLAVCGDSAGGNLSAVAAQYARNENILLRTQVLVYPAVDASETDAYPSRVENSAGPILLEETMHWFFGHYLGDGDVDRHDARLSPLHQPLAGTAPALIITAEHDILRDEGEAYARALEAAGVQVALHRYDGMPHGFFQLGGVVDDARAVVSECAAFLKNALS